MRSIDTPTHILPNIQLDLRLIELAKASEPKEDAAPMRPQLAQSDCPASRGCEVSGQSY